jgi:hypothetical protein
VTTEVSGSRDLELEATVAAGTFPRAPLGVVGDRITVEQPPSNTPWLTPAMS